MDTYHKINALYKRHTDGKKKGKLIHDDWAQPEFEYLAKNKWEFTEKIDGTNIRVNIRGDHHGGFKSEFGGRSDNAQIPQPLLWALEGMFGDATAMMRVEAMMRSHDLNNITLYGEGVGQKVQGSDKYLGDYDFILFDVKVGDFWLNREAVHDIGGKLNVTVAPVIGRGTLADAVDIVTIGYGPGIDGRIKAFSGGSVKHGLKSAFGDFEAEGIVARPAVDLFDRAGRRIITKIKAVDFK